MNPLRATLYGASAIAVLAAIVLFLLPALIHIPVVRADVERRLSAAVQGKVSWQDLDVDMVPAPRAEFARARIEVPGKAEFTADELEIVLRGWPLLLGRVEPLIVRVKRARLRLAAPAGAGTVPFDAVRIYREAVAPLTAALRQSAPDTHFAVTAAALDLQAMQLQLEDFNFYARTGAQGVAFDFATGSPHWKRLAAEGRVEYADLAAQARVELEGWALDAEAPRAAVHARMTTDARGMMEGDFDARLGKMGTAKGRLLMPAGKPPHLAVQMNATELTRAVAAAQRRVPGIAFTQTPSGRLVGKGLLRPSSDPKQQPWSVELELRHSEERQLADPEPEKPAAKDAAKKR
jgi:uncharacterized protein involved in outer membrane biogenesis